MNGLRGLAWLLALESPGESLARGFALGVQVLLASLLIPMVFRLF